MNDLRELLEREAARVETSPELPHATARRARRARLRTGAVAGMVILALVSGGVALGLRRAEPPVVPAEDDKIRVEIVEPLASGIERGTRWELTWRTFAVGDDEASCLSLEVAGESRGCAAGPDELDRGNSVALVWVAEVRRTIVWGTIPPGQIDVEIDLLPGGGYAGRIFEGRPARPNAFIQFIPGPEVAGTIVAYGHDEPIWAYGFETDGRMTQTSFAPDPEDLRGILGPGGIVALDSFAVFEGRPTELWLRLTTEDICLAPETGRGFDQSCVRLNQLDGGVEVVAVVRGTKTRFVAALVGPDVAEVKIEFRSDDYPQQLFDARQEDLRYFSTTVPLDAAEIVAYDSAGRVLDREGVGKNDP